MHIFLTGSRQVGKSTAINKAVETLGVKCGGYKTVFKQNEDGSGRKLFMIDPERAEFNDETTVAVSVGEGMAADTEKFNTRGVLLLNKRDNTDVILMDELGWMERDALGFKNAVLGCLKGDSMVIGVIRDGCPGWTKEVARAENVRLITVTEENRDSIPDIIIKEYSNYTERRKNG